MKLYYQAAWVHHAACVALAVILDRTSGWRALRLQVMIHPRRWQPRESFGRTGCSDPAG